jgi:hypothetical protein
LFATAVARTPVLPPTSTVGASAVTVNDVGTAGAKVSFAVQPPSASIET